MKPWTGFIIKEQSLSMAGTGAEEICEKLKDNFIPPLKKIKLFHTLWIFLQKIRAPAYCWIGKLNNDNVDNVKQSSLHHNLTTDRWLVNLLKGGRGGGNSLMSGTWECATDHSWFSLTKIQNRPRIRNFFKNRPWFLKYYSRTGYFSQSGLKCQKC